MELLKRFEESDAEEADLEVGGEDGDALARRLEGIDLGMPLLESLPRLTSSTDLPVLDSVPPDELWDLLPEEQRSKFLKMMEDPSSGLTEQLLADGGFLHKKIAPWWRSREDQTVRCPAMMSIPDVMVERMPSDGPSLLYNICAVW